jgi:acetate---CoA ligase (ADP-forming)
MKPPDAALSPPPGLNIDAVLRDGSTVHLRPPTPADQPALARFLTNLSEQSRVFRFFAPMRDMERAATSFTDVDYVDRHGLLALRGDREEVVGHGFYARTDPGKAEVALAVADDLQGMGLGTLLLGVLAQAAERAGILVFEAEVMPENHRMLTVFRQSGFQIVAHAMQGSIHIELPTSLTEEARMRFDDRQRSSAIAALRWFFAPERIAVIGASRRRGTIAGEVFHNLIESGFPGGVFPVSPHPFVQSIAAVPDVRDIPGQVDLAVIVVPAGDVVEVARGCAEKQVRALAVISAGFAEVGEEGRRRQAELLEVCRRSGMRLIGPNCMGLVNTDPERPLNATFAPVTPTVGNVGFMSQSGALGLAVIDQSRRLGLGLSTFVSVGNKADISGNDLLEHWESDGRTQLVMLYLESFGNPRRFARIARRVGRIKPILAVKSGRTPAGARATSSHTGALLAASDVTVDALFRQSGVIRADTLAELFDVASLLANQPAPAGRRVGIITNAGGLGILCADACSALGLEVPELSEATRGALREALPAGIAAANPIDLVAGAGPEAYRAALTVLGRSEDVDAIVAIFIPPLPGRAGPVAKAIEAGAGHVKGKPVLTVFMSAAGIPAVLEANGRRLPVFTYPEDAAQALARAAEWAQWKATPEPVRERPDGTRPDEARSIVASALARGGGWLSFQEAAQLMDCYGVPLVPWEVVEHAADTGGAARRLGGPVAMKALGRDIVHKSDVGAVRLDLRSAAAVRRAAKELEDRMTALGHPPDGFLVQRMAQPGSEIIVGVVQDPVFGPVVACGAGGTTAELLKDVAVRLTPLDASEAEAAFRSLASFPLLDGYRGRPRADLGALVDTLVRVSWLAEDLPAVAELDLNPVVAGPGGAVAVDVRLRVEGGAERPYEGARSRA